MCWLKGAEEEGLGPSRRRGQPCAKDWSGSRVVREYEAEVYSVFRFPRIVTATPHPAGTAWLRFCYHVICRPLSQSMPTQNRW